ncbi:hypothetical protein CTEN210_15961 [Chaetoceros tenuissimus]|uniref:LNR domain-containing protein n=1 Tax=Chaetoceros tenuissimus TaxID=426638 RepID=A0AAD3DAP7_9STRA|nr:hypothetical protein CTEN210_15961 [Chaetoceros tenuissimus]
MTTTSSGKNIDNRRTSATLNQYLNCTGNKPYLYYDRIWLNLGDGICDNFKECGDFNSIESADMTMEIVEECGWDGGDCIIAAYPDCHVYDPSRIANGICDNYEPYNTTECGFDMGDCTCSGLECWSAGAKVGIVIGVLMCSIGLCYFGSRRHKRRVENKASLEKSETSAPLPQPV